MSKEGKRSGWNVLLGMLLVTLLLTGLVGCDNLATQSSGEGSSPLGSKLSASQNRSFWQEQINQFSSLLASSDWWVEVDTSDPRWMVPSHIRASDFPVTDPAMAEAVKQNYIKMRKEAEASHQPLIGNWYQLYPSWPGRLYSEQEKYLAHGGKLHIDHDRDGKAELVIQGGGPPFYDVPRFLRDVGRYPTDALDILAYLYPADRYSQYSQEDIFGVVSRFFNPFTGKLRSFYTAAAEPADPQPGDIFMHRYTPDELEAIGFTPGPDPTSPPDEQPSDKVWFYKLYGWDGLILDLKPYIRFNKKLRM